MKDYLKSLIPYRWIFVFLFIFWTTILLMVLKNTPFYYYIINFFFWFIIDFSFGLGREEKRIWRNIIGMITVIIIIILLCIKLNLLGVNIFDFSNLKR